MLSPKNVCTILLELLVDQLITFTPLLSIGLNAGSTISFLTKFLLS